MSADCLLLSSVASFLIFPRADPLLSSKSVASFFKKLSAFSHQRSASEPPESRLVLHFCHLPFAICHPAPDDCDPATDEKSKIGSCPPNGFRPGLNYAAAPRLARWLRSSLFRNPILCYQANRWLRFSKNSQLSAISDQLPNPPSRVLFFTFAICLLPFFLLAYRL